MQYWRMEVHSLEAGEYEFHGYEIKSLGGNTIYYR